MPTSNIYVVPHIINLVHQVPHTRILEIGCGYGKYGLLLRECLNEKPEYFYAVDATQKYVDEFKWLRVIYDQVACVDCLTLDKQFLDEFDVVLIIDVIEHLDKEKAKEMLSKIRGRVIISTPVTFFEQNFENNPYENHVSHWTKEDFPNAEVCYEEIGGLIVRTKPKAL